MQGNSHTRRRWRSRLLGLAALAMVAALRGEHSRAADPQPYKVSIAPTGNAALDQAAHDSSTLIRLHDSAPVGPFALIGRARGDAERMRTVLNSFGYYKGSASVTIAGRPLDDPGLADLLDNTPAQAEVPVQVTMTLGPQFHLGQVTLPPDTPAPARDALKLKPGDPALAADVLAARDRMKSALLDAGYALAKVGDPQATLVLADNALNVSYPVEPGPRVDLGPITITGEKTLNESYLRRRLALRPGERFSPVQLEKAREDLAAVPAIGAVRIDPATAVDAQGTLPVTVQVTERPLHAVNLGAAWSTDLGGSVSASWTHRNLFGNAEQLTLSAAATELGGTAVKQPGYNVGALLVLPDWLQRRQSLSFNLQALRQYLDAYDRTALIANTTLSRKLSDELTVSGGLQFEAARFRQEGVTTDYELFQVPLGVQYDTTHTLLDPEHGVRAAFTVTPSYSLAGSGRSNSGFVIAEASGSTYLDVGNWIAGTEARSILALRALVGTVSGADVPDLPPDQRFYAGGGGTVRGFRYQSIGPKFADGKPKGGNAIDVGSIEFRQRIGAKWGGVAFVDAGQLGTGGVPFSGHVAVGAGVGVRYYTPIGPIRADIAVPLTHERGGDSFELYIGIGQSF